MAVALVIAVTGLVVEAPAQAQTNDSSTFYQVTDMDGNEIVGPGIDYLAGGADFLNACLYGGAAGTLGWTRWGGLVWIFLGSERWCIPELPRSWMPLNRVAQPPAGTPGTFVDCWQVGAASSQMGADPWRVQVTADPTATDTTGHAWVFDHWELTGTGSSCAEGLTSTQCTFTTAENTAYFFHAYYHRDPAEDTTAPTATPTLFPRPGPSGWSTASSVEVRWNWADEAGGSGIDPASCTPTTTVNGHKNPRPLATAFCSDLAGNRGFATQQLKFDQQPPSVSWTPGPVASFTVDQRAVFGCTAQDTESGIATTTGCESWDVPAADLGLGAHVYTARAVDVVGHIADASVTVTVSVTPASLCNLTSQYARASAKYQALSAKMMTAFDQTLSALCTADLTPIKPGLSAAKKKALVAAYTFGVKSLARDGWLTTAQANQLAGFAAAL